MKCARIRKRCKGTAAALLCLATWATQAQSPSDGAALQRPTASIEDRPSTQALTVMEAELRRDLAIHPNSASTLYDLGRILQQENKPKESLEAFTQAAALEKPTAGQLQSVALDYVLLEDFKDATHWLEVAKSLEPQNVNVLYSLGRCYYSQGKFRMAEDAFLKVLQIKPDHWKAEENLGLTLDAENEPDKAEPALRKAVEGADEKSNDEWPFLDLGSFLLTHGRSAEALAFLQRATAINPKCAACHEKLGRAFATTGSPGEAVSELELAVQLDPRNPKIHFELGRAYRANGSLDKSRAEFALSQTLYGEHSKN